jgi:trans-2,3-dihydro-3-hydroxyanthranilic acid synthase
MTGIDLIEPYVLPTAGDLPENTAGWSVDPDRAVLLVHDMQRYFLRPFAPSVRDRLIANCVLLRERAAAAGMPVGYSAQPGGMTVEQRGLLQDFWGMGMNGDAEDRQIVDSLWPAPDDWTFAKWRYSAFFRSDLFERMCRTGRDQLVLCGVYAHVGVLTTALDAFTLDLETFVVADAVADFSAERHRMAMDYAARTCAVVTTAKEVLP